MDFADKGIFHAHSRARFTSKGRFCGHYQCRGTEAIVAALPAPFTERLPPDMLPEMKKLESIDDLVDYLHKKMDSFYSPVGLSPTKELRDRFMLWTMLGQLIEQLEDRGLDTPLEKVLKVGQNSAMSMTLVLQLN